ncbi:MAG: hypothetical protein ACXIUW_02620 [Roseinatronobacter sp.]
MMRSVLVVIACLLAKPGFSGDFSHNRIIGFAGDGAVFIFKTYGLQRGSGEPYASFSWSFRIISLIVRSALAPRSNFRGHLHDHAVCLGLSCHATNKVRIQLQSG